MALICIMSVTNAKLALRELCTSGRSFNAERWSFGRHIQQYREQLDASSHASGSNPRRTTRASAKIKGGDDWL
jgi:hypothetical protein